MKFKIENPLIIKNMIRENEKEEFINELINIYNFLSYEDAKEIVENIIDYRVCILENNKIN